MDHADWGLTVSAPINHQWDGVRGTVMEGSPIPCATELTPLTYRTTAMGMAQYLISTMPSTERREASSWRVTTSSVMGLPTLQARHSPRRTCVTNPKSTHTVPYVEGRTSSKGNLQRSKETWRWISLSDTSGHRERTVFRTCVSSILTPPPTSPKTLIDSWKPLRTRIKWSILTPASNRFGNSITSLSHWTAFSSSRQRQHWNISPAALRQNVRNPTHKPAGTWSVGM